MEKVVDKGNTIAVQRALDAFNRARGGFVDRQTAMIYLLEALERDWNRLRSKEISLNSNNLDIIPTFEQLARAASRLASE
jgi:hypothetical protein